MPEYGVARQPFQTAQDVPMMQQVLYGILNMLYGSDAIQDAPLDMMMPLGGIAKSLVTPGVVGTVKKAAKVGKKAKKLVGPSVDGVPLPMSRQGEVSPTGVTPFELQQLGLFKGAPPYKMGSK